MNIGKMLFVLIPPAVLGSAIALAVTGYWLASGIVLGALLLVILGLCWVLGSALDVDDDEPTGW